MQLAPTPSATEIVWSGHSASWASVVDVLEILLWIGAATRAASRSTALVYSEAYLSDGHEAGLPSVMFREQPLDPEGPGSCWHKMFRNPVIAKGFPIPRRPVHAQELEIPLEMMAGLGCTPWITNFAGNTMLKGFSTLFAATSEVAGTVIWHFVADEAVKRMPYVTGLPRCGQPLELDALTIETARHFVGWTPHADVLLGAENASYDGIADSASAFVTPGVGLASVNLSGGKFITAGLTFVRGQKDTPVYLTGTEPYELQVSAARSMQVALYDTYSRQGWLVDGASALLHISRAWLSRHAFIADANALKGFEHANVTDGLDAGMHALMSRQNRELRLFSSRETIDELVKDSVT